MKQSEAETTFGHPAANSRPPAPCYYEQLAIRFRKEKCHDNEIALLRRFLTLPRANDSTGGAQLRERLGKAQAKKQSQSTAR